MLFPRWRKGQLTCASHTEHVNSVSKFRPHCHYFSMSAYLQFCILADPFFHYLLCSCQAKTLPDPPRWHHVAKPQHELTFYQAIALSNRKKKVLCPFLGSWGTYKFLWVGVTVFVCFLVTFLSGDMPCDFPDLKYVSQWNLGNTGLTNVNKTPRGACTMCFVTLTACVCVCVRQRETEGDDYPLPAP